MPFSAVFSGRHPERSSVTARLCCVIAFALAGQGCSVDSGPQNATSTAHARLISQKQYFNTVEYVFGPDITLSTQFAPFRRVDGLLANGGSTAGITVGQMREFQRTAGALAEQVVSPEHRNFLIPCKPAREDAADEACATQFLSVVGRLLQRRPLDPKVQAATVAEAGAAADRLKDFYAGLAVALEGLLISPDMLFIIDQTEPDPKRPGQQRLDAYSLASRLSFFLWDAAPDDELLQAAQRGDLYTSKGRARAVDRMLASPRLEAGVRAFFDDMLAFDEFAVLTKDPGIYPAFSGETLLDAREQTLLTIYDHVVVKKGDYRDLFTSRETFISPALALLYDGVSAPPGWSRFEVPADSPRVGLLTQVSFLAGHSHPGRSSPTLRGKALRELLLCQIVPRPPPNVDFSQLENPDAHYPTQRDRVAAHLAAPSCAGCHRITDPIGLALENFDGAGRYRTQEGGTPIDASGNLDGKPFTDAVGLGQALRDNPGLPACLVKRMYSYSVGGSDIKEEKIVLPYFRERFEADGYRVPELMRTIAMSTAFSSIAEPAATPAQTQVVADRGGTRK
ncbi:MAG TPA: DUF1592 domain-containing protein [Povalibacter sp.]|nr:DUF1592 domain-containing protein [Povalibacter sp.]